MVQSHTYLFVDTDKPVVSQKKILQFRESIESLVLDLYHIISFQAQCEDIHQFSERVVLYCCNGVMSVNSNENT